MAVVKGNGYGHGLVDVARAAVEAGADWLGTAQLSEAITLRKAGITVCSSPAEIGERVKSRL